jgi:hypothetical protein
MTSTQGVDVASADQELRLYVYEQMIERGHPPGKHELARRFEVSADEMVERLRRLERARALLVASDGRIEAVPPFSALPTPHWVETDRGGFWGHTAWQALAVPVVVEADAQVFSRSGGRREPIELVIRNGKASANPEPIVHVSVPAARWWDDVRYTCASILFFRDSEEIDEWCRRGGFARGAILSLSQCWRLAREWYAGRLEPQWRRLSAAEAQASLGNAGLTGDFWDLSLPGASLGSLPDATGDSRNPERNA